MGNVDDDSYNVVLKDIANKIGNQKEDNQWKRDRNRGKTNQSNVRENKDQNKYKKTFQKYLEILINIILLQETIPSLLPTKKCLKTTVQKSIKTTNKKKSLNQLLILLFRPSLQG